MIDRSDVPPTYTADELQRLKFVAEKDLAALVKAIEAELGRRLGHDERAGIEAAVDCWIQRMMKPDR